MNIIETNESQESLLDSGYHIHTFADSDSNTILNTYGKQFGLNVNIIQQFSHRVNENNESGSLHPKAPISAVPCDLIRDKTNLDDDVLIIK